MSDTPRTDAAYAASTGAGIYELFKESQDIERELNAANDRIKRLEDCAETAWGVIANVDDGGWHRQRPDWREAARRWFSEQYTPAQELSELKAKEAKP